MANKSPYVRAETEMAFSNSKPIFPVRQSDIKPAAGLAFFLKIRHWTDAYGPDADASMDRLAAELQDAERPAGRGCAGPGNRTSAASAAVSAASRTTSRRDAAPRCDRPQCRFLSRPLAATGCEGLGGELELGRLPRQFLLVRLSQDVGADGGDGLRRHPRLGDRPRQSHGRPAALHPAHRRHLRHRHIRQPSLPAAPAAAGRQRAQPAGAGRGAAGFR